MNDNDGSHAASSTSKIQSPLEDIATNKSITKEELRELPLVSWDGPIDLLNDEDSMVRAVDQILQECASDKECILGFDTETRPVFQKGQWNPTALIQIATPTRVYLFRVCKNKDYSFAPLLPILESPNLIKCGVAITFDVLDLLKVRKFTPRGFVELQSLVRQLGYKQSGLRNLAGILMGKRISKGAQMANWEKPVLKEKEVRYAATDAWLGREIFLLAGAQQAQEGKSLSGEERLVFTEEGELVKKEKDDEDSKQTKKKKASANSKPKKQQSCNPTASERDSNNGNRQSKRAAAPKKQKSRSSQRHGRQTKTPKTGNDELPARKQPSRQAKEGPQYILSRRARKRLGIEE